MRKCSSTTTRRGASACGSVSDGSKDWLNCVVVDDRDNKEITSREKLDLLLTEFIFLQDQVRIDGLLPVVDRSEAYGCGSGILEKELSSALLLNLANYQELVRGHWSRNKGVLRGVRVWRPIDRSGDRVMHRVVIDEDGHTKDVHWHVGGEDPKNAASIAIVVEHVVLGARLYPRSIQLEPNRGQVSVTTALNGALRECPVIDLSVIEDGVDERFIV